MRILTWCFLAATAPGLAATTFGQSAAPSGALIRHTFENGVDGWMTFGQGMKLSVSHDMLNVEDGRGALQCDYAITKGQMAAAVYSVPGGLPSDAQSIRFTLRAEVTTPVIVFLQEGWTGPRYLAGFTAPKGRRQRVELSASDFALASGPNDPKDPNGKLDLSSVVGIGLADLGQLAGQADAGLAELLGVAAGPRRFWIDEFVVSSAPLDKAGSGPAPLDLFARPQLRWLAAGTADIAVEGQGDGRRLRVDYGPTGKGSGLVRFVTPGALSKTTGLSVTASSTRAGQLLVLVEETGGGKYVSTVELVAGAAAAETALPYASFRPADDSKDANSTLDADRIQQVVILDISALASGGAAGPATLWVSNIAAK